MSKLTKNDCTQLYLKLKDSVQDKRSFFLTVKRIAEQGTFVERCDWSGLYAAIEDAAEYEWYCESESRGEPSESFFYRDGYGQEGFGER